MPRPSRRGAAVLTVGLVLLSACAQEPDGLPTAVATALDPDDDPSPSSSPSEGDAPTTEPTPSPPASPSPTPSPSPAPSSSPSPSPTPTEEPAPLTLTLHQAAYDGAGAYTFEPIGQLARIRVGDLPDEADPTRWAMVEDGDFRLYFLNGDDGPLRLLPFVYAGADGYVPDPELGPIPISGFPSDTDTRSFAMLHDGQRTRLYFRPTGGAPELLQGAFDPASGAFVFGFSSIERVPIVNVPSGAAMDEWAMLHDGTAYRLYVHQSGRAAIHQFVFDADSGAYDHTNTSLPTIDLRSVPSDVDTSDFAMVHSSSADYGYSLYYLER